MIEIRNQAEISNFSSENLKQLCDDLEIVNRIGFRKGVPTLDILCKMLIENEDVNAFVNACILIGQEAAHEISNGIYILSQPQKGK